MTLLMHYLPYLGAIFIMAFTGLYLYFTRNFGHWKQLDVLELKPVPFFGNLKDVFWGRRNIGGALAGIYEEHKDTSFVGIYRFDLPVLQIHDPNIIKDILINESQNFVDRSFKDSPNLDPIGARSLFDLKGDKWKASRSAIASCFSTEKITRMQELIAECVNALVENIGRQTDKQVPVYEVAARYTIDSIASCAFGIEGNSLKNPDADFRKKFRLFFEFSCVRSLAVGMKFFAPGLAEFFKIKILPQEGEAFIKETITSTVAYREKFGIHRGDFLDSLIQLKDDNYSDNEKDSADTTKCTIEEEDLVAHSQAFLLAGFETSASTIANALFELAKNQQIQTKLRKEIQEAYMSKDDLTYEEIRKIKYLDMVMRETLRKYPSFPILDRENMQSYSVPGSKLILKPRSRIVIPLQAIHMDPKYFPSPNQFDPERFSDEKKDKIVPYTFMPFGEGPRICLGKCFAFMQMKYGLVNILRKFSIHPGVKTPHEIEFNQRAFLLQAKKPIILVFRNL